MARRHTKNTTCIVGLGHKGKVYMGADSLGVCGYDCEQRKDAKVFKKKDMIIGYTSSFRMGQLLRFKLDIPDHPKKMNDYRYMCTLFVDSIRQCFKDNGFAQIKDNEESIGTFLVGYKGKIYKIEDDMQVAMYYDNYTSCGCGESFALGALMATKGDPPKIRVRKALEAAEKFSAGVRRPFKILSK